MIPSAEVSRIVSLAEAGDYHAAFSGYVAKLWAEGLAALARAGAAPVAGAAGSAEELTRIEAVAQAGGLPPGAAELTLAAVNLLRTVLAIRAALRAEPASGNGGMTNVLANFGLLCLAAGSAQLVLRGVEVGAWATLRKAGANHTKRAGGARQVAAGRAAWTSRAVALASELAGRRPVCSTKELATEVWAADPDLPGFDRVLEVLREARREGRIPPRQTARRRGSRHPAKGAQGTQEGVRR